MTVTVRPTTDAVAAGSASPLAGSQAAQADRPGVAAQRGTSAAAAHGLSFEGVLAAADVLAPALPPTPSWSYPLLDEAVGRRVVVKHENVQPTGAFKVRGGLNLLATLPAEARERGLGTVSTGNHAQSLAYAAAKHGVAATIVMAESTAPVKVSAVRALGARAVLAGANMAEAAEAAAALAEREGLYFVNPGEEPAIIHGHATVYLELLTAHSEIETLYVPIGSGSGAAGAVLVRDAIAPHVRVVGVQAAGARAAYDSWATGEIVSRPIDTFAAGLATGSGFHAPQSVLRGGLNDFLLLSEQQMRDAIALMAGAAHTLCEGAGASGLAGALADRDRGYTSVAAFACTGGNASDDELANLMRLPY
ncbi:threonine ammonia-lyase [Demequina capsici]|uniref:threonine ammonia-lyase n=1 Tax=Demequina capsici TaxID=3075620 RepID=A0AA96J6R8_9MICO|nr:pyridoxal-phosphate dependent enzyme [Demequina sp. OYTSA14]WNM23625.1 pyridoxal-phosphate dependent enzyme [Demequina sp. OYTSA14]